MKKYHPSTAIQLDTKPVEHEEAILAVLNDVPGLDGGVIKEARLAGMSFQDILGLLAKFGPQFAEVLMAILAAIHTPVPLTPAEAAKAAKKGAADDKG